ncbi:MAG TPA: hypothetical protein VEZ70_11085 [Allosphingosinicella sp.]|nr:hypothetical protein [Allosphingosinicella sp.]
MTPDDTAHLKEVRRRQRTRAIIMALLLGAFVALVYGITIVRMTGE